MKLKVMRRTQYNRHIEFDNYNNSRWEFTKRRSEWHFDPQQETQDFVRVCQFTGSWDWSTDQMFARCEETHWATRNSHRLGPTDRKKEIYSGRAEQMDLLNAGANPFHPIFDHCVAEDQPAFNSMSQYLGLEDYDIHFKSQRTGHMFHLHIDNFAGRHERGNSFKVIKADKNPELMRRFLVMLSDWKLGQFMQFGTQNFTHWRRGDVVTWDWQDIPYSWCNAGWEPCPLIQLTGWVTDRTQAIMESNFQVIEIKG